MMWEPYGRHWMLDRRVPIAVILTLLVQMGGALVWATQLDARVAEVERQATGYSSLNEKFARLDQKLDDVQQNLAAVRRQLDHMADRVGQ